MAKTSPSLRPSNRRATKDAFTASLKRDKNTFSRYVGGIHVSLCRIPHIDGFDRTRPNTTTRKVEMTTVASRATLEPLLDDDNAYAYLTNDALGV